MSTAASTRGDSLKAEGNKALNRTLIFGFGKQQKFEDAAEAFKNAGNAYKLASLWQSAGDVFMQAGDAYMKVDSTTDATACVVEAAQCYKKVDPNAAVIAYQQAIDMYNTNGRFGMSSRYAKEMAEVYEQDNNAEGALKAYESAAELYNSDNKKSNANQCLLKVATLSAEKGDLSRAAGIYEDIARESMTSRLGAYSAKGYFFQVRHPSIVAFGLHFCDFDGTLILSHCFTDFSHFDKPNTYTRRACCATWRWGTTCRWSASWPSARTSTTPSRDHGNATSFRRYCRYRTVRYCCC